MLGRERDEDVFERRRDRSDVGFANAGFGEIGADRGFAQRVIDEQVHGLAEDRGTAHTLAAAQGLEAACDMVTGDVEPARALRRDFRQGLQFVRLAAHDELRHINVANVRATFRFIHVVRGDEERHATPRELEEQIPQLAARDGVDAGGGFVEEKNLRLVHERAGHREALTPARR